MSNNLVDVQVTNKDAIYVDDCRITNRATKWGIHSILDRFECRDKEVVKTCLARGHESAVAKIDDSHYLAQRPTP